jgi:kynurenine formamidase
MSALDVSALDGWISLAQPVYPGLPSPGPGGAVGIKRIREAIGDGGRVQLTRMSLTTHTGTHLDAPAHFVEGGATIDLYPLERFVRQGVVIDASTVGAREVTAADLSPRMGNVRPGDIVFLDFGWGDLWGEAEYGDHPYLSVGAAELLIASGASIVAIDTPTPDLPARRRAADFSFPVHRVLLSADVLILENVSGAVSALRGRVDVSTPPLPLRGADGAPCVPLVRVR